MLPMLHKHTVICAALIATLGLSACGSKKDTFGAPPPTPTTGAEGSQETKVSGPSSESQTADTSGQMGNLPDPYTAQAPETPYYEDNDGRERFPAPPPTIDDRGEIPEEGTRYTPPVADVRPAPAPTAVTIPPNYVPDDKTNVDRRAGKRLTGAVSPNGLLYTSSSTDALLDFLRARNERVSSETRRANIAAAASVVSAQLSTDSWKNATLTLKVQEGRDVKVYNMFGAAEAGPANTLSWTDEGHGELTTGRRELKGTLKCVDWDGGCTNKMVRLTIGSSPYSSVISIVFRDNVSDIHFDLPGQYSSNYEYLILREFAINSITRKDSDNRLLTARMSSWEVVNGRSGVTVSMTARNGEFLGFASPLLAPENGTAVNIPMTRVAGDNSRGRVSLRYANWISDARLTANNGLGQVRVLLSVRGYANDKFAVTFMRKLKPVVDLTNRNLDLSEM